jgi:hypothetical protein
MARGIWVYAVAATIRRAAHLPVVPMPPGTIYPDEAAVIWILALRRAEFTAARLNVAAAAATLSAQRDTPPYGSTFGRNPVSRDGQGGCG